ncbi:hypothetical protein ACFL27_28735 [candidate division CSSED10-310 bacterium]|uniref:Gingipain domain-containing protein n=1 Tax=candidate division CSSED10-310 bacterium TaxID=2855610 RepID=A0ABV6Z6W8_UNCC1
MEVIPYTETDSTNEFTSSDYASGAGSNHDDSNNFDSQMLQKGYEQRGKARDNGNYDNLVSKANFDYMVHGGVQNIWFSLCGFSSEKRQIREQADWLYWSGHGHHSNAKISTLEQEFAPSDAKWDKDINAVIIAGCSVLDIKDYRAQSFGAGMYAEWILAGGAWSPGAQWEPIVPEYLVGYNWYAPLDTQGSPTVINNFFIAWNSGNSVPEAWKIANDFAEGRNACVIDNTKNPHEYWYWDETSGSPVWTKVIKGGSSW